MPEIVDSRNKRFTGALFDRTGNYGMAADEREQRMQWYEQSIKRFDFNNPICPKCGNYTFFGIIYQEKGWQYYHCGCGFQAHKEIKLDRKDCTRDVRINQEYRPDLKVMVEATCQRCGKTYTCSKVAQYKGRKYCDPCKPEVQRELKTGVKKGQYKARVWA